MGLLESFRKNREQKRENKRNQQYIERNLVPVDRPEKKLVSELNRVARSEVYYFDADGNACEKEDAVRFAGTTYDKDGNRINETWGTIGRNQNPQNVPDDRKDMDSTKPFGFTIDTSDDN